MMQDDQLISNHYSRAGLIDAIHRALIQLGKSPDALTLEDLKGVDEFHIGGRDATEHFFSRFSVDKKDIILDIGCGLGGPARYMAHSFQNSVIGIDLTPEYVEVGNKLSQWVGLTSQVHLQVGNAINLPFEDEYVHGAYMIHVGMNILHKRMVFEEVFRVVKQGGFYGIYDIMRLKEGELVYPVPWANQHHISHLGSPEDYAKELKNGGFQIKVIHNRRDYALTFFEKLQERRKKEGGSALGLHLLMQEATAEKIENMLENIKQGLIAPVEIVGWK